MFLPLIVCALLAVPAAAIAAPKAPTLAQRVQRMEDESTIRRMLVQYGAYLDARDFAGYSGLFAAQGEWVGGFGAFKGPAAIQKTMIPTGPDWRVGSRRRIMTVRGLSC